MTNESRIDRAGAPASTLYDVARAAGVSTATVSRVMHGQDRVSPATRRRVLEVIEDLGYVPDGAAQSLSRRRKDVIGLVAVERFSPESDIEQTSLLFVEQVLRGVEALLREIGWSLLISFLQVGDSAFERLRAVSGKVDGLLISEGIVSSRQLADLSARLPIVLVAGSPDETQADVVDADNRTGTRALAEHLVEVHGRTRLFYAAGPTEAPDARERRAGFEEVLAEHPGASLAGAFEGQFSAVSGQAAARHILAGPRRDLPDAVVCGNDQMAIGVIRELAAGGMRVPEDMAVVGFDDIYPGAVLDPPLTTVRQPMRQLGERACSLLLDRLNKPGLPHRVELLPTELVVRASCGCPYPQHEASREGAS
ncbi:MAG TPA: LacI family DNA-binding transcriptional regulator [Streptosporangiaceae bacterium]|jgi:LacI family transcriptional regulator